MLIILGMKRSQLLLHLRNPQLTKMGFKQLSGRVKEVKEEKRSGSRVGKGSLEHTARSMLSTRVIE